MISTASILIAAFVAAVEVSAHGIVSQIQFGSVVANAWDPSSDPYQNPKKEKFTREFNSNGPVLSTDPGILCNTNGGTSNVPTSVTQAGVNAGDEMTFFWTVWSASHKGPTMTYMADCQGDCSTFDATGDVWFKIDESGLTDGVWASDTLIANNNTYKTKIPATIAPGQYLIRHELLALHEGNRAGGAQFYPSCHQVDVASSGTLKPTELVAFPGAYSATDPGIAVDIYNNLASYTIPGPAVIEGGTSGGGAAPGGSTGGSNGGSNGGSSASSSGGASPSSAQSSGAAEPTGDSSASSSSGSATASGDYAAPTSSDSASAGSDVSASASGTSAKPSGSAEPSGSCVRRRKARRQLNRTGARL